MKIKHIRIRTNIFIIIFNKIHIFLLANYYRMKVLMPFPKWQQSKKIIGLNFLEISVHLKCLNWLLVIMLYISKKYSTMHDMCGQKSLKVEKLLLTLQTLLIPFYFNKGKYFSMYTYSTPARTLSISGLKSRVLKLPFLT